MFETSECLPERLLSSPSPHTIQHDVACEGRWRKIVPAAALGAVRRSTYARRLLNDSQTAIWNLFDAILIARCVRVTHCCENTPCPGRDVLILDPFHLSAIIRWIHVCVYVVHRLMYRLYKQCNLLTLELKPCFLLINISYHICHHQL